MFPSLVRLKTRGLRGMRTFFAPSAQPLAFGHAPVSRSAALSWRHSPLAGMRWEACEGLSHSDAAYLSNRRNTPTTTPRTSREAFAVMSW